MEEMDRDSPVSTRTKSVLSSQEHVTRRSARHSRVHFDEDGYIPQLQEANPIVVQVIGEEKSKTIGVYLGFLQEEHRYDIKFTILSSMVESYLPIPLEVKSLCQGQEHIVTNPSAHTTAPPTVDLDTKSVSATNGPSPREYQTLSPSSPVSTFLGNLEVFSTGEFCQVTSMEWCGGRTSGLLIHMNVTVPSTKDHHVLEDTFSVRSATVSDRFIRVNIAAKIMGKTMGTPTLKDGIKCIGLCPQDPCDSSNSSGEENEVDMDDAAAAL